MSPSIVEVFLFNEKEEIVKFPYSSDTYAEQICIEAAKRRGIGPIARHLFSLRRADGTWLNPSSYLEKEPKCSYEFRLRFRVFDHFQLFQTDSNAFDYYFYQCRHDFLKGDIPETMNILGYSLGLGVMDMYRVSVESKLDIQTVQKNYRKFVPKDVIKANLVTLRYPKHIQSALQILDGIEDSDHVKRVYINQVHAVAPKYICEAYEVQVPVFGGAMEVIVTCEPFNKEKPGLWTYNKSRKNVKDHCEMDKGVHLCTIEELCFISMRNDNSIEISRKNGVPQYFIFNSTKSMHSFIGLLDGYYRLMEKWTFNLCKDLSSPFINALKSMKCHGPVGSAFSRNKLFQKRKNEPGCYIIREGTRYNRYHVDICVEGTELPITLTILKTEKGFHFVDKNDVFPTLNELLTMYNKECGGNALKECLPPSEYDNSRLLLCKVREDNDNNNSDSTYFVGANGLQMPVCFDTRHLKIVNAVQSDNRLTAVAFGTLNCGGNFGRSTVALKLLNKSKFEASKMNEFLEMSNNCLRWHCETIVTFYGMTLTNPLALVMEHLPLGPLDNYLRENQDTMSDVDLVEASVYLGKALWYLEEIGVVHGNICCKNVLVAFRGESTFKVKLTDPGIIVYKKERVHWIPPECYSNFLLARSQFPADVWAFGIMLWETFSYGQRPLSSTTSIEEAMSFYQSGGNLLIPDQCNTDVYKLMTECWIRDPDARKKPQAIVRDINQILYEVHNSRRLHTYATVGNTGLSPSPSINSEQSTLKMYSGGLIQKLMSSKKKKMTPQNSVSSSNKEVLDKLNELSSSASNVSLESMVPEEQSMWLIEMNQLQIGTRLGQGFYGEVHKASLTRWAGLDKETVAVKQLRPKCEYVGYDDLSREISIMKSLQHKNIVEIKGVVEDPKLLLVMEYVPLGSMLVYINTNKERLSEKHLLKFSMDIAEGMEYLDQKRIVHRDLAARNILVASENTVKISDFGLAQKTGVKDYYKLKTNRDLPVRWYAPETLRMWKFTSKSDAWSFGVTLWEMFSYGKEPIIDGCKDDELLKVLEEGRRLSFPKTCSLNIYTNFMMSCWNGEPDQRPTFTQLLVEIKELYESS